jgi:hypothetical protein
MLRWIAASRFLETSLDEVHASGTGVQGLTIPDTLHSTRHGDKEPTIPDTPFTLSITTHCHPSITSYLLTGTAVL